MYAFSINQPDEATVFEAHLHGLAARPDSPARNTAIVIGGGFTGIEIATELPARLRSILGDAAPVRVVLIEQSDSPMAIGGRDMERWIAKCEFSATLASQRGGRP